MSDVALEHPGMDQGVDKYEVHVNGQKLMDIGIMEQSGETSVTAIMMNPIMKDGDSIFWQLR